MPLGEGWQGVGEGSLAVAGLTGRRPLAERRRPALPCPAAAGKVLPRVAAGRQRGGEPSTPGWGAPAPAARLCRWFSRPSAAPPAAGGAQPQRPRAPRSRPPVLWGVPPGPAKHPGASRTFRAPRAVPACSCTAGTS